ncbi:MAG: hypothetical protein GX921_01560 [Bacteroidales bacterium]|nr:hypothetical protein [Bacteroidales bacterium]
MKETIREQQILPSHAWLKSIFECQDGSGYCFPDEEHVLTEQYYQFFIESLQVFEYPDFETEEEQVAAEKAYESKWKDIYPVGKEIWYPFGRGNGVEPGFRLENVVITHLYDLIYSVMIHFGDDDLFLSTLQLVQSGDAFLIDYVETVHLESGEDEQQILFLQNFALANFQLGSNPLDAKRLMGEPLFEETEEIAMEVSGFIDEDYIAERTTMEYDGVRLVYQDNQMIHAFVDKPGKSLGWVICEDENCDKNYLMEKFKLTQDFIFENDEGGETIIMGGHMSLRITLDKNELVKTIEFNTGP